jgi:hypothetical protein
MKNNSLMAIGFGFILLLCLPMFLAEIEINGYDEHPHEIIEVPPLGVKRFYVEVCMIDSSVVSHSGEHRDIPHIKEYLRSRW